MENRLLQSTVNANGTRRLIKVASYPEVKAVYLANRVEAQLVQSGECKVESAAFAQSALHAHLAAHLFDNHTHDG